MPLGEPYHTDHVAKAGAGLEAGHGGGVVLLRRLHAGQGDIAEQGVSAGTQGEVDCHTLGHGGIGTPLSAAAAVGCGGTLLPALGEGVLTMGLLDGGPPRGACACQMSAALGQSTRGPPLGGIALGLGQHPAAQPHGHVLRIARVVCGVAAINGRHGERMAQDTRQAFASAEVG